MYKEVDLEDGEDLPRNAPEKRKLLNHFLTADCWAHSPKFKIDQWCLPIRVPNDTVETVERIRQSLTHFLTMTRLSETERIAAWAKLSAAAKKHGIDVPDQMPRRAPRYNVSANHRMTVTRDPATAPMGHSRCAAVAGLPVR